MIARWIIDELVITAGSAPSDIEAMISPRQVARFGYKELKSL